MQDGERRFSLRIVAGEFWWFACHLDSRPSNRLKLMNSIQPQLEGKQMSMCDVEALV